MDYTPNTPEIRSAWVYGIQGSSDPLKVEKEFDRWLEEHDRQVAEKAHDEGFKEGNSMVEGTDPEEGWNPYRREES